jgi:dTDP-4-dehydrorhamnose 3,5-epimerase-like enzyme
MSLINLINFSNLGDTRGSLIAIEGSDDIPFPIKRVYYIYDTKGVSRGFHAHIKLKQVAICLSGKCRILLDNGYKKEEVNLDSPHEGLLIDRMIWREMHDFSDDCVLLVLASENHDESDYIRDYKKFRSVVRK